MTRLANLHRAHEISPMSSIGRNDPCPCGSGKKYKQCCLRRDESVPPALRLLGRSAPERGGPGADLREPHLGADWQADLVAVPTMGIGDDPDARPAMALVAANGFIVHMDLIAHPPTDHDAIGVAIGQAVVAAMETTGQRPSMVSVRFAALLEGVRSALAGKRIDVRVRAELRGLDAMVADFDRQVLGRGAPVEMSARPGTPQTWMGWGLPRELIGELFAAAAEYFRAAPWEVFDDNLPLMAHTPGGAHWVVDVMGSAGETFGLAMYASLDDLTSMYSAPSPEQAFDDLHDAVLSISFNRRDELPKPMRREVKEAGWEIAGLAAYPLLFALNTPAAGVTEKQMRDLTAVLHAMPAYVQAKADEIRAGSDDLDWRDPGTGIELYPVWQADVEPGLWEATTALALSCPQGAGATPDAFFKMSDPQNERIRHVEQLVERFEQWLTTTRKPTLSATTAHKHGANARLLLESLVYSAHAPASAISELDLRVALYDDIPRKHGDSETRRSSMLGSLTLFFNFLDAIEHVECPWAWPILSDRDAFNERWATCPNLPFWDPGTGDWLAEFTEDLADRVLIRMADEFDEEVEAIGAVGLSDEGIELQRRWLVWRDEEVAHGRTDPAAVAERLVARQREWRAARHGKGASGTGSRGSQLQPGESESRVPSTEHRSR